MIGIRRGNVSVPRGTISEKRGRLRVMIGSIVISKVKY